MSSIPPAAQEAIALARRGDTAGALDAARKAVAGHPDDYGLRLFVAALHQRRLELDEALPHVRRAVELAPSDPLPRIELVRLLIGLDRLDEAEGELRAARISGLEPHRLQAMIHARRDDPARAAEIFQQIVAADPRDYESWGNLGACFLATSQPRRAADAFSRALELRPDLQKLREKLLEAQVNSGQGKQALAAAREAAAHRPDSVDAQLTVARLEDLLQHPDQALETLRSALASDPDHLPALLALANLLERQNAIDEFAQVIARIEKLDPAAGQLPLLKARLAFRRGELERALEFAQSASEILDPGSRDELIGKIEDRLGNSEAAFRAFERMNRDSDLSPDAIAHRSGALRDLVDRRAELTTQDWVRDWTEPADSRRPEPAFLVGFPRSGTTLLDTFLMGHSGICIAEEKPMLQAVSEQLGEYDRLAALDESELRNLRDRYFEAAAEHVPDLGDRLLIDKYPLGTIDIALIHRLFPKAKIIRTVRHPCDVILSCFMTRFQPTATLVSFYTLEDAAKLYDRVMNLWERSCMAMPLDVHTIKYEALVADPETEMRSLVAFLGLEWNAALIDHERAAEGRSFVGSASYAQVVEPLYDRSVGRWKRYAAQLAAVLPLLEPWSVKMGYGPLQP
ncbi:MAG TPA: sulfotransferase [Sphingomicrobium sp.]|jgi:tetratricopeptide (TPR) repeat protein|nr:sulfotransferase [Sphingomicrobium sp.]